MKELIIKQLKAHKKFLSPEINNTINRKHFDITMEQIIKSLENNTELSPPINITWYEYLIARPKKYQEFAYELFEVISDNINRRFVTGYSKVYTGLFDEKN